MMRNDFEVPVRPDGNILDAIVLKELAAEKKVKSLLNISRGLALDDLTLERDDVEVVNVGAVRSALFSLVELLRPLFTLESIDEVDRTGSPRALRTASAALLVNVAGRLFNVNVKGELLLGFGTCCDKVGLDVIGELQGL